MIVVAETILEFMQLLPPPDSDNRWLYRGQANEAWSLIPSIARIEPIADTRRRAERDMIEEFKRYAIPYLVRLPATEWEWLALAQHHGLPTRLLDWARNPLAALLFAVSEAFTADSAVWCYRYGRSQRPEDYSPYDITDVYVLRPVHFSGRVTGQSSYFTAHPMPSRPFDARPDEHEQLIKIVIPQRARVGLRIALDRLGVNFATLFPDLDGVARHIRWSHTVLADERQRIVDVGAPATTDA
jgi:hypothetical protein